VSNLDRKFRRHGYHGQQLPAVEPVPGIPEGGFLLGSTVVDNEPWDVILYPETLDHIIREHGKDNTTGLVVTVPKSITAKIAMDKGVAFDPKNPPKDIIAQMKGTFVFVNIGVAKQSYVMALQTFVSEVLNMPLPSAEGDQT
jgi:hypothetical protein